MQTNILGRQVEVAKVNEPQHGDAGTVVGVYVGDDDDAQRLRLVVELDNHDVIDAPAYYFKFCTVRSLGRVNRPSEDSGE